MTRSYVRTTGGQVVHKAGCRHLRQAHTQYAWSWAEGRTLDEIELCLLEDALGPYHFCHTCFGFAAGGDRPTRSQVNARIREIKDAMAYGRPFPTLLTDREDADKPMSASGRSEA